MQPRPPGPAKILHLIGQLERGGAEGQLLQLAQALRERGWDQVIVTFRPGEAWDDRLAVTGLPLRGVPRHRNKLWRLWRLGRIVRSERPALIHSWSQHTNVYASWLWSRPRPRRIFAFRHDPTADPAGRPTARVANARIYARADRVVSNSRVALESARAAGVALPPSEVVDNIVIARGRARPGEAVAVPRIAAAGLLIPLKAYDVLLRALGELAAAGVSFELALAGDGPERPRLERLAADLGLKRRVSFLGGIDDVPALLATAHLLVHPSRSEGLSNTILEALAEGLPVVATAVGGTPELIADGRTGLLVAPDEPVQLAARIRQVLDDPSLGARLGRAGLELVRDRCTVERVATQHERIYRSVLSG